MRDILILLVHVIVTAVRLMRPSGVRSVIAESVLLRHQLLVLNRPRQRAPVLRPVDQIVAGLCAGFMRPARLLRSAIVLEPATILQFHRSLVKCKYRQLFSPKRRPGKPGPKGPSPELVAAIVETKRRNPRFGYQRIADQISLAFDIPIDKDTVRRVLTKHYRPEPRSGSPSRLALLGHSKDSLWSADLFRCESLVLNTHWVMVVMDQCTQRIIGFAAYRGAPDGPAVCHMFGRIISGTTPPAYLSSEREACPRGIMIRCSSSSAGRQIFDPRSEATTDARSARQRSCRSILEIEEIKTVPYVPLSHPFVERLIGTTRREYLDHVPFRNARDLERKLSCFQDYYNRERAHQEIGGIIPEPAVSGVTRNIASLDDYRWKSCCRGLFQPPIAA